MHTRVNQRTILLFPWPTKKYHGIKPSAVGSAQRVRERTGVTEGLVVAIASRCAVSAVMSSEYTANTIEIGGDQISMGEGEPVMVGSKIVERRRAGQFGSGFGHPKRGHDRWRCPSA